MDQGSQQMQMQMTQSSAHRQQGMKNMWNNHHDEEAVVLPKGHYLQEASNISKTNRGGGTVKKPLMTRQDFLHTHFPLTPPNTLMRLAVLL